MAQYLDNRKEDLLRLLNDWVRMAVHLKELNSDDLERIHLARNIVHYKALVDKTIIALHVP